MVDTARLDAIASRLLTAERAARGARHLANVAVELGKSVDAAGVKVIRAELLEAYQEVYDVLAEGDPADVIHLAAQLDPT
jgi:hypothetical protein